MLITLGTFGSKLLPFILIRLYTTALKDGEYNTADLITQTARLLIPFAALGLTEGLFRLAMEGDKLYKKKVFTAGFVIFGGGFAVMISVLVGSWLILGHFDLSFKQYIPLIGVYILSSVLHSLVTQYIRTKDHFAFFSLQGVINTALVAVLNIIFYASGHFGVFEYVFSVILADFIVTLLVIVKERLWRDLVKPKNIEKDIYQKMIKYAAPLIPTAVSWWVTSVSDRYMVRFFVSDPNIADFYSAAYKIPTLVTLLCTVFSQAWSYSSVAEDDEKERSAFFSGVFSFYFGLLFLMASVIVALAKPLTGIMMDPSYHTSWIYIPTLVGATVFSALSSFVGSVYTVRLKSNFSMWTAVLGAGLNLLLNFLLIPDKLFGISLPGLGALGAAIATAISYGIVFLVRALTAKHYVDFKLQPKLLSANIALLTLQILCMTLSDRSAWYVTVPLQVLFLLAFSLLDGRKIWITAKRHLKKRLEKQ